jgi:hypothetical protein
MPGITTRQHATILQKRCRTTIATSGEESDPESFGARGVIRVGPVESCGDGDYCFEITEEDVAMIRGQPRRQTNWACTVVVTEDGDVEVYEVRGLEERVPPGVVECATTAISETEYELKKSSSR